MELHSKISLTHNHAHDGFGEVLPEAVLSQTGMENHSKCEHALVNDGPPRPVCRAYLSISRDGHGVPEIAGKERRHVHGTVARSAAPHFFYPIRTFLDTSQHELIARPALVAFRHISLSIPIFNAHLIYTGSTNQLIQFACGHAPQFFKLIHQSPYAGTRPRHPSTWHVDV